MALVTPHAQAHLLTPRTSVPRPPLPVHAFNNKIQSQENQTQQVKFQIILREGQEIVVGRIKVATPQSHAFILRRFDTGAISLSTMFRACFPDANDESEKAETSWVKSNYDTAGSNGGGKLRLAGTWIPTTLATHIAQQYGIPRIVDALVKAAPEDKNQYRKNKAQPGSSPSAPTANEKPVVNAASVAALDIPTSLPPTTPRATRSAAALVASTGGITNASPKAGSPARQPPAKRSRKSASPAPSLVVKQSPTKALRSSPRRVAKVYEEEEEADVPAPDPDQDIAEAKADVDRIKAEYAAAQKAQINSSPIEPATPAQKRTIEDADTPPHRFDMEKIENGAMELVPHRPVINPRRLVNLPPARKAAAWGSLAFLIGLGASVAMPALMPGGSLGLW